MTIFKHTSKHCMHWLSLGLVLSAASLLATAVHAQTLGTNLAITGPSAGADGSGFNDTKLVRDGDTGTYTQASGTSNQRVSVKWGSAVNFNTVILRESGSTVGTWELVNNDTGAVLATGSGIGAARTVNLGSVSMKKLNLIVSGSSPLRMAEIEVYNASGTASSSSVVSSAVASSSAPSSIAASSTPASSSAPASQTVSYEAESGSLSQAAVESNHTGYNGSGFVNFDNLVGSSAQWTVNQASAGTATITFRYANGTTSNRAMAISVNGTVINSALAFNGTGAWATWATQSLTANLNAGSNVIRAVSTTSDGGPNLDQLSVTGGTVVGNSSSSQSSVASSVAPSSTPASSSVASSTPSSVAPSSTAQSSSSVASSQVNSSASSVNSSSGAISAECIQLATNPSVNWRDTSLQSDQAIVECLSKTLGKPVGYGENAKGGYDPNGNSKLTIITKNSSTSVEQQILNAITGEEHNWIVFDKIQFAQPHEIGMYRLGCSNPTVQSLLGATEAECVNYTQWCAKNGVSSANCVTQFFNTAMNKSNNPIRNPVIGSNKTIDGRGSEAYFLFSGFAIGKDSTGSPTQTATSVILTHLNFKGAGHTEDHYCDPDMIRSTGASHDIWIHKNTFDTTGDSAFDVKVGAYGITMSFNEILDVKRATLHSSSDSHTIDAQIRTTMHHNLFVTRDASYDLLGNTLRRVPLIRRGSSHMLNNAFINYRKDLLSIRVGASVLQEDNMFVVNRIHQEKSDLAASLAELQGNLIKDVTGGNYRGERNFLWFGDAACNVDESTKTGFTISSGTVANLMSNYSSASQTTLNNWRFAAGQDLVDYLSATAGKYGEMPFNSPLAGDRFYVLGLGKVSCQN
ncbi:CBM35 domain-containing protein [Cellvibrio sp. KY-YJ-3]|uniref:pectate lyase family protein n=1 Tax=Cellvibrio sp. KY-YJ-3 TaxID=454662 RepID=UPI0012456809|nr:CBM35 domain-containing protein [Cellvibrio sp. KY-YJ-3]QEY11430.1 pectate lyase [Cellvibrio sp. KY-YJ-3]